jgi:4-amino-4-deoxy-L-arabinose transferase-like glycosyltransferase
MRIGLIALFLLAGAIRLYKIEAPGLLIDREYTSAMLARDFYFQWGAPVEDWRRAIAHTTRLNQPVLEPPITECLMALIYKMAGSEQPALGRLLTSAFWLAGGAFLYKTARLYTTAQAAIVATAFYLLSPLSILLSRSLQPDSLMMLLFLASLLFIARDFQRSSSFHLSMAAGVTALALLYRPLVLFALIGAVIALALSRYGATSRMMNRRLFVCAAVSLLPMIVYYGYGILIDGFLHWKVETSFRPYLLVHREFWKGWFELGVDAVGPIALIAALLGAPLLPQGDARALVLGLGVGYVLFGLAFTMHIHTHGYYHAQLIPLVGLASAPTVSLIGQRLKQLSVEWYWRLPVVGAAMLLVWWSFREVRQALSADRNMESVSVARRIGEIVHHSSRTVYLARYYGLPLQYNGELSGAYWPRRITYWLYRRPGERERSIDERLNAIGFTPEFFVITDFAEYEANHADLAEYLEGKCSRVAVADEYLIYDACAG